MGKMKRLLLLLPLLCIAADKPQTDTRDEKIVVPVTKAELMALEKLAKAAHLDLPDFIRWKVLDGMAVEDGEATSENAKQPAVSPDWKEDMNVGEWKGGTLCGIGSITSTKPYEDFLFETKIFFNRENSATSSVRFCFGLPAQAGERYYQVIITERDGGPKVYLQDCGGTVGAGKQLFLQSLPKPLYQMPGMKLSVQKRGTSVSVGLGSRVIWKGQLDRPDAGCVSLVIGYAQAKCESVSLKP